MLFRIVSKKAGFRRCGVEFSGTPVDYPADKFTKEQIAALKAEPMLVVVEIPEETPSYPAEAGSKNEKK